MAELYRQLADRDPDFIEELLHANRRDENFVNARDADGRTVLHYAAMAGDTRVIQTVLVYGACAQITDRYGKLYTDYLEGFAPTAIPP